MGLLAVKIAWIGVKYVQLRVLKENCDIRSIAPRISEIGSYLGHNLLIVNRKSRVIYQIL